MNDVRLSVVATLYRSARFIGEFYDRCCAAAGAITSDFEIIFVDDGSPDDSLEAAIDLYRRDPRVRVFSLSRNFGHHKAMMTGLARARGDLVFLVDVDLEVGPEVLGGFHARLREEAADVVFGVQDVRHDSLVERLAARTFYAVFNRLSPHPLPVNLTTARLMTRRYVRALLRHGERETIIAGLWAITGYKQVPAVVQKASRDDASYSIAHRVAVLTNAITSFSDRPLVLIFYVGFAIFLLSGGCATYLVARRLLFGTVASGWLSLIVSTWVLGGLVIFCLGIIGIYLSKVFLETKQRPYTIVREVYDRSAEGCERV